MPRKLTTILFTICLLVCCLPTFSQAKEKRVALILGNGVYAYPNALKNPAADAYDLEQALKQLGFEVISGVNINKQQTEKLIEQFGQRLAKTRGVGLFYYSGVGFRSAGENFLVPVDANFDGERQLAESSIPLSSIFAKFKAAKAKKNIILLDATRKSIIPAGWQMPVVNSSNSGFSKVPAPEGTLIFYSSESGKVSSESCGRNGLFLASFLRQLANPVLEFSQVTEKVATEVNQLSNGRQKPFTDGVLKKPFYAATKKLRFEPPATPPLDELFDCFKVARKQPCGQRGEAIAVGREILEKYSNDTDNSEVIKYVKKETEKIEGEDSFCRGNDAYNAAYKAKDWPKFISLSKDLIAREGASPLALDIMLTLVSVGYDQAVFKNDAFNADTINYAKQAILRIENGGKSSTGRWGVFVPFQSTRFPDGKTSALNGLNYMLGWINYNRPGGNKKEGLSYLYKSTQYKGEFSSDYTIYTSIGDYYFGEAARLDKEYRDIRATNDNMKAAVANAKLAFARGYADRAIDAFGRAYKSAAQSKASPKVTEAIKRTLNDIYKFRFNIPQEQEVKEVKDVEIYFENLISRPMPNPKNVVEPVLQ